jgi:hypothetical protein
MSCRLATICACDFAGSLLMAAVPTPVGFCVGAGFLLVGMALTIDEYTKGR